MNIGEKLSEGFVVFIIGILVVFAVLMILWALLTVFRVIFYDIPENKKGKKQEPVAKKEPEVKNMPVAEVVYEDDEEIVAVITAAIASMLGKSESSFKIKSIKRTSKWNRV